MILNGWQNESSGDVIYGNKIENLTPLAFSGIHCINSTFLKMIKKKGKFSIIEEYISQMKDIEIKGYQHDALLIDVGRPESVVEAEKYFK